MANEDFDSFLWRATNYHGGKPEVYEDTHDEYGNYIGSNGAQKQAFGYSQPAFSAPQQSSFSQAPQPGAQPAYDPAYNTEREISNPPKFKGFTGLQQKPKVGPLPKSDQFISPRLYQNIVLYEPKNAADVERLIDYIRRLEPAIVDLDPIADTDDAQRVLDFTSGAVFALKGRIIEIRRNMFLIVPEGIDVAKPEYN